MKDCICYTQLPIKCCIHTESSPVIPLLHILTHLPFSNEWGLFFFKDKYLWFFNWTEVRKWSIWCIKALYHQQISSCASFKVFPPLCVFWSICILQQLPALFRGCCVWQKWTVWQSGGSTLINCVDKISVSRANANTHVWNWDFPTIAGSRPTRCGSQMTRTLSQTRFRGNSGLTHNGKTIFPSLTYSHSIFTA